MFHLTCYKLFILKFYHYNLLSKCFEVLNCSFYKSTETGTEPRFFYPQKTGTGTEVKILEPHSSNVLAKKVSSAIGSLKRIRQYAPRKTLLLMYNSLTQAHFDYCDIVWHSGLNQEQSARLQSCKIGQRG